MQNTENKENGAGEVTHNEESCSDCQMALTIHADGTIACGCNLRALGDPAPTAWSISTDEMREWQLEARS